MSASKNKVLFIGAIIILILSIIAFVYIPAMASPSSSRNSLVFGKWDGKPVEYKQNTFFLRQMQTMAAKVQNNGQELNQFTYYQIMQSAFQSAIVRLAVLEELEKAGYTLPRSSVNKALLPYYEDENGKYSPTKFSQTSATTRTTRRNTVTEDLTAERYIEDVFGTQNGTYGLKVGSKELDLMKTMSGPERSFVYASYKTADYPDSEAVAFGKENASLFVQHDLSLITVDDETTAKKVEASLAKKEISFEDAVTTYSTRNGTDAAGKLTNSFRNDLNNLFTDANDLEAVLALQPDAISTVVKAGKSFAIVKCNSLPKDPDFSEADIVSAVMSYMKKNERGKIEDYFMAKAKNFTAKARIDGFDAACTAEGLEKKTTTPFGINYGSVSIFTKIPTDANPELTAANKSETFFNTAFSLASNEVSDPVLLGDYVVVLQVAEETAADPQTLEMLPRFYTNYYATTWSQTSLTNTVLASDKLEDNFMSTYLTNFLSNN